MVVVYLKNGEKAPMMDANYVRLEPGSDINPALMLRCYIGNSEVGQFKWEEVAGYTIAPSARGGEPSGQAWVNRLNSL